MVIGETKNREIFNALAEVPKNWNFYFDFQQNMLCLVNDDKTVEIHIRNFIIRYPNEIFSLRNSTNEEFKWN